MNKVKQPYQAPATRIVIVATEHCLLAGSGEAMSPGPSANFMEDPTLTE